MNLSFFYVYIHYLACRADFRLLGPENCEGIDNINTNIAKPNHLTAKYEHGMV